MLLNFPFVKSSSQWRDLCSFSLLVLHAAARRFRGQQSINTSCNFRETRTAFFAMDVLDVLTGNSHSRSFDGLDALTERALT